MDRKHERTLKLRRAHRGLDLWTAVEAAQYGRILDCQTVEDAEGTAAVAAFEVAFGTEAETWETRPEAQHAAALAGFDLPLRRLEAAGLFLHVGLAECRIATAVGERPLPFAVLHVSDIPEAILEVPLARWQPVED